MSIKCVSNGYVTYGHQKVTFEVEKVRNILTDALIRPMQLYEVLKSLKVNNQDLFYLLSGVSIMVNSFITVGLIVGFALLLSSCKKTYTCECHEYFNGTDTSWTALYGDQEITSRKEDAAQTTCKGMQGEPQTWNGNEYGLNCQLK